MMFKVLGISLFLCGLLWGCRSDFAEDRQRHQIIRDSVERADVKRARYLFDSLAGRIAAPVPDSQVVDSPALAADSQPTAPEPRRSVSPTRPSRSQPAPRNPSPPTPSPAAANEATPTQVQVDTAAQTPRPTPAPTQPADTGASPTAPPSVPDSSGT